MIHYWTNTDSCDIIVYSNWSCFSILMPDVWYRHVFLLAFIGNYLSSFMSYGKLKSFHQTLIYKMKF